MKAWSIKIKNEKEIRAILKKKGIDSIKVIGRALEESADIVVEEAQIKAPFLKGYLKRAIAKGDAKVTKEELSINIGIKMGRPFTKKDSFYARFQELGTSKMSAQPYLRPALDTKMNQVKAKFIEVLKRLVK